MIQVREDWWKDFFNDIYLVTDARSVSDDELTRREADMLEAVLKLDKPDKILDMCGGSGRHSIELARRGYKDITVLDYSDFLIDMGKSLAKKEKLKIDFVCRDARSTDLKENSYSAIFIMANSFGYFLEEEDNLRILKECHRLLEDGGRLLLDLTDADYMRRHLKPFSRHKADEDTTVCRFRELTPDSIKARELVVSKKRGLLRDGRYCERIYDEEGIESLLANARLSDISINKGLSLHQKRKDYGFLTSRMIVTSRKR
ncbi:MAG: class I SAM-dependent methyltransferase [Candidatus Omnitrophica bacterium]|nr:class I SAM-dependent methyltransferase [Candidatus Omnitrophota bacterium]